MSALSSRVRALESKHAPSGGPRRIYSVSGVGTDDELAAFLTAKGWGYDPVLDLVILRTPMAPATGMPSIDPEFAKLKISHAPNPQWRLEAA